MDLYFLRHGDAEPASAAGTDGARQLTDRGRRESRAIAQAAHRAGLRPEAIFTSPLTRARQTADILQEVFRLSPEVEESLRSGFALGHLQDLLSRHSHERILLVGHQPDLSTVVGQLIGDARLQMAQSGLAYVQTERIEPGCGVLVWLLTPKLFAAA